MAQATLLDISHASFQVVLRHLTSVAFANLRQVNRTLYQRTTQHLPHIVLRLSDNSSIQQLQQWCQATQHLQHVPGVHICVTGAVPAEVFDAAIQLLSQRSTQLQELHLLAAAHNSSSKSNSRARIRSLQPLRYLLPNLRALIINGISVQNFPDDVQQLATASTKPTGWQLQKLSLVDTEWTYNRYNNVEWRHGISTLRWLPRAFPALEKLNLQLPKFQPKPSAEDMAALAPAQQAENYDEEDFVQSSGLQLMYSEVHDMLSSEHQHLHRVATVAAVANAVLQLKHLEVLAVTDLPDIWEPTTIACSACKSSDEELHSCKHAATTNAVQSARFSSVNQAAAIHAFLSDGMLSSASAAAEAMPTLDDCGCWLLESNASLRTVDISTRLTVWSMSWQRQQQLISHENTAAAAAAAATTTVTEAAAAGVILPSRLLWIDAKFQEADQPLLAAADGDASNSSGSHNNPLQYFDQTLSHYSSRPASALTGNIRGLDLEVCFHQVGNLAGLLKHYAGLASLQQLKVALTYDYRQRSTAAPGPVLVDLAEVTATAAAASFRLEALDICAPQPNLLVSEDMLLPLTAAGGPGRSLKKLKLSSEFAASDGTSSRWHHALCQLSGLRELIIDHTGMMRRQPLTLPVECLPTCLQVLNCSKVVFVSGDDDSNATRAASAAAVFPASYVETAEGCDDMPDCLSLSSLKLFQCQLSSPSILASRQLQQLTVIESSWSGGWTAAATAWPNVTQLVWGDDQHILSYNELTLTDHAESREQRRAEARQRINTSLQEISVGFKLVRSLTLHNLPWLTVAVMRPVVQHLSMLRYIKVAFNNLGYWALLPEAPERSGVYTDSNTGRDCIWDPRLAAIQRWMQQQMPWASVIMSFYDDM